MSVSEIKARIYPDARADSPAARSEGNDFDSVVDAAIQKKQGAACRSCYRVAQPETAQIAVQTVSEPAVSETPAVEAVEKADAVVADSTVVPSELAADAAEKSESSEKTSEALSVEEQNEGNRSAMYRFTMFVRISGDFGSLQQSLIDEFKDATVNYVNALRGQSEHGVEALDTYLNRAETSAGEGVKSARSFLDEIISAADAGLKVITSGLKSSAWMSGLNLNGSSSLGPLFSSSASASSSSSLFSNSSALDIAKLQLQSAMENSEKGTGSATAEMVDYGSGYRLAMLKGQELAKVDASGNSGNELTGLNASTSNRAIEQRNYLLERFLQLIDNMSASTGGATQVVRAGFSFAIENGIIADYREVGKATGAVNANEEGSSEDKTEPADAAEEIIA